MGDKTANYFNQTWQQLTELPAPTVIFPSENAQNNEGLLNLPIIQAFGKGDYLQIWRGIGGRELLADTLAAKGASAFAKLVTGFTKRNHPSICGLAANAEP